MATRTAASKATKATKASTKAKKPTTTTVKAKPKAPAVRKPAVVAKPAKPLIKKVAGTGKVLDELKSLAKELNKAAKGLSTKNGAGNPKEVSAILGSVERMTADAANKSLVEAEAAKQKVTTTLETLSKNWSRQDIEAALKAISGHLTNIMVAQEFQDLAGQALRKATKALVGAIIVVEGGGPTEDQRLSQKEIDGLLKDLMP
jgi:chemotaxis regulatin CheY-phosphate phosphatase CheZ